MDSDERQPMSDDICFLDGEFLPLAEARISPLDRGFLFGDGVYEVIPVYHGRLFRFDAHMARLERSLGETRIDAPYDRPRWRELMEALTERRGGGDLSLYLQVTRGAPQRRDHAFPDGQRPTVFMMASPLTPPDPRGRRVILVDDTRGSRCDIKSVSLLANVLLRQAALDAGADEAVVVRDGQVTEGAASNLFIVEDGTVITPPNSPRLLPGITRDLILELAAGDGIPCREAAVSLAALRGADEVWLSSSTKEIIPVTHINDETVAEGRAGPVWRRMRQLYDSFKATLADGDRREAAST